MCMCACIVCGVVFFVCMCVWCVWAWRGVVCGLCGWCGMAWCVYMFVYTCVTHSCLCVTLRAVTVPHTSAAVNNYYTLTKIDCDTNVHSMCNNI